MPRPLFATLAAGSLLMLTALSGCGYPADGNPLKSVDEYNYPSTSTMPQTLVLRDLRTDQVLFTWEIPVGKKLFVKFYPDRAEPKTDVTPDQCEYLYYPVEMKTPPIENRIRFNVPPASARRLELIVRPSPELPSDMKPSDIPQPPTDLPPAK